MKLPWICDWLCPEWIPDCADAWPPPLKMFPPGFVFWPSGRNPICACDDVCPKTRFKVWSINQLMFCRKNSCSFFDFHVDKINWFHISIMISWNYENNLTWMVDLKKRFFMHIKIKLLYFKWNTWATSLCIC